MEKLIHILFLILFLPILNFGQEFTLDFNPKKVRKEIRKITEKIGEKNVIHSSMVGFAGERTKQYDRFERLVEKARVEELVELMQYPKPAVRGYAFWALAKNIT